MKTLLNLRNLRRAIQILSLGIIVALFLSTEYRGQDTLPYPVGLLFRLDPLAALAAAFAPGSFPWKVLWPALALLLLTALFGRFFCGWICPLGTTLDGCGKALGRGPSGNYPGRRRIKYYLLVFLVAAGFFGVQLFGLFDPLAIFLRTLTLSLYPAANLLLSDFFDFFYQHSVPLLSPLVNGAYPLFRDTVLAFQQPYFTLSLFTVAVFAAIIFLEKVERRFWCKNLCPLGALFGLCASRALLLRRPGTLCTDCRVCTERCRAGAVTAGGHRRQECLLCLDCSDFCPERRVTFNFNKPGKGRAGIDLSRRGLLASLAGGVLIAPVAGIAPPLYRRNPYLLRPPGAVNEAEFLRRCIRCGECLKVCIGGALHPAFLQAGATGLWTPLLVPRIGYCEYNCTLCGQVCPTGAIRLLPLAQKKKEVVGLAVFDKNRCLPFAEGVECLVCEEHCPTGEKAIVFEEREVLVEGVATNLKFPRLLKKRCVGCGICETKCPIEGSSAIRVINEGESRRTKDAWV